MALVIFDFQDYKAYTDQWLTDDSQAKHGARSRLARALGCQPGYVSRVLSGDAHFSLEQADLANQFFGHTEDEGVFFILLVEHARAGTPRLRNHFQRQLEQHRQRYLNLKSRLQIQNRLGEQDQVTYYSHWHYAAIHALVSVPGFQSKEAISSRLKLPMQQVANSVDFLVRTGLLSIEGDRLVLGTARLHLGSDSPLISKHHINWRLQAIQSLERDNGEDLHYSSVVSLSEADLMAIKGQLIKTIESVKKVIRTSKEETLASFSMDFFKL